MDFPILSSLILLPVIGGLFIFFTKSRSKDNTTSKYLVQKLQIDKFPSAAGVNQSCKRRNRPA